MPFDHAAALGLERPSKGIRDRIEAAMKTVTPGARRAPCAVALLLSLAPVALAAQQRVTAASQFEARLDAILSPAGGAMVGLGVNVRAGWYTRLGLALTAGAISTSGAVEDTQRIDATARFLFDPFAEGRRAFSAGAGLGAQGYALCLMACDDTRIATLNTQFRGKPPPTNVLSWPSQDRSPDTFGDPPPPPDPGDAANPLHLGDIALAWETCTREAGDQAKPLNDHACHLIVHGVLHLLGYDHDDDEDATLMERIEIGALATLGIANPY